MRAMSGVVSKKRFYSFDVVVTFSDGVLGSLHHLPVSDGNAEQGGILLGVLIDDLVDIVAFTLPGQGDISTPRSFVRSSARAQLAIKREWIRSKGAIQYVGEWHTHPGGNPDPSPTDRSMIAEVEEDSVLSTEYLFLLIVGGGGKIWIGRQQFGKLTPLRCLTPLASHVLE